MTASINLPVAALVEVSGGNARLHPHRYRMGNRSVGILGAISICTTGAYDLALFMPSMMAATFLSIWVRPGSVGG